MFHGDTGLWDGLLGQEWKKSTRKRKHLHIWKGEWHWSLKKAICSVQPEHKF